MPSWAIIALIARVGQVIVGTSILNKGPLNLVPLTVNLFISGHESQCVRVLLIYNIPR